MIKNILLGGTIAVSLFAVSCSKDDEVPEPVITPTATTLTPTTQKLNINITGLTDLGANFVYEGWLIINGSPVSTGTFTVNGSGAWTPSTFYVKITDAAAAAKFVLTIEPAVDPDPAPSAQKLIAGDFSGTTANISTATAPAIGDFSTAAGQAFLRTPTDETGTNNGNDENGIWFGIPGMPPAAGLTLPTLPAGWVYEGWVVGDAGPISTGTFTAFNAVDNGNPFSGTQNNVGPPIPGEDFFLSAPAGEVFPLDLRGRTVVITVEPSPDNSPAPFFLKPLLLNLSTTAATAPTTHSFGQNLGSFPTGTVVR